jgi:hypothetical protein
MIPRSLFGIHQFQFVALVLPLLSWVSLKAAEPENSAYRIPTELPAADEVLRKAEGHPLASPLKCAYQTYDQLNSEIRDYTCMFIKRERIGGKVKGYHQIETKVRHRHELDDATTPFSVYMRFLAPGRVKDREVLYVEGSNNGKMFVRQGGQILPNLVHRLVPDSRFAMRESNYAINEFGMRSMVTGLIDVLVMDLAHDECEVVLSKGVEVKGRKCTHFRVTHPIQRPHFRYHIAQLYVDEELQVPIYYAAYTWPREEGGPPKLLEEFAYKDIKLNVGLRDEDFDRSNPNYGFGNLQRALGSSE